MNKAVLGLPDHFAHEYPKFVQFINLYFTWKDRGTGVSQDEWDSAVAELGDEGALLANFKPPGITSTDMQSDYLLERKFSQVVTSDNMLFVSSDDRVFDFRDVSEDHLQAWYDDVAFPRLTQAQSGVDDVLFLKLIPHIGQIRGTAHAIKLFFKVFFDEAVTVEFPRDKIAIIDNGFTLDSINSRIRDDYYYDEFAYVIKVANDPSQYQVLFNTIFMKYFHAGGFTPILEQI